MFGCMPIGYCGYNSRVSDTLSTVQMGLAGFRGVVDMLDAKNNGASTLGAISYGLTNTAFDVGGVFLGNAIDKSTHSYMGTTMNTLMSSRYAAPFGMSMFASSMYSPYGLIGAPYMMNGPMMYGLPRFGGFCCHC